MAEMLNLAEKWNSDQLLEKPFKSGDMLIQTIGEGVEVCREQAWKVVYIKMGELLQQGKVVEAKDLVEGAPKEIKKGVPKKEAEEAKKKFPDGWEAPKPYLRIVPQPK